MDFLLVILFLVLYYVRPHEWIAIMATLQPTTKVMAAALAAVCYYTGKRVHWRPLAFLGSFLQTPHDWVLLAFTLHLVTSSADAGAAWASFYPLVGYYVVVRHALSTPRRLEVFMWVWLGLLLFISTMAVLSEFEVDPFGSYGWTHGMYKGRLVLGLSIFQNPNALAHSVILIVPMIYFLGIWRRILLLRELALPLFIMPFWCLYWTASKGAYICGAAGAVAMLTIGRPKWFKIGVGVLTYAVGLSALMLLPRMHDLESVRDDAGVKGRLLAWNFAWQSFETLPQGLGYGQFTRFVPEYVEGKIHVRKPTHSSYVEVGAELGKRGLFIWLGILYYSLKSLVLAKAVTDQEERLRRLLFSLVIIYMASSWMTNISYRGTFFIQTAAVAALTLHLRRRRPSDEGATPDALDGQAPEALPEAVTVGPPEMRPSDGFRVRGQVGLPGRAVAWLRKRSLRSWLLGLGLDFLLVYVMFRIVVRAWLYFMFDWRGV